MIAAFPGVLFIATQATALLVAVTWPRDTGPGPRTEPREEVPYEPPTMVIWPPLGFAREEPSRVRPYVAAIMPEPADFIRWPA